MRHLLTCLAAALCGFLAVVATAQGQDGQFRTSLTPEIEFNNHIEFGIRDYLNHGVVTSSHAKHGSR